MSLLLRSLIYFTIPCWKNALITLFTRVQKGFVHGYETKLSKMLMGAQKTIRIRNQIEQHDGVYFYFCK